MIASPRRDGGSPPPLPHFVELDVPRHWRCVDLISDLHLSPSTPHTVQGLRQHLQHTRADAVFLLGDVFELWLGDDALTQAFEAELTDMLAEASTARQIGFMAGNRDFLLGSAALRASGMRALADPTVLCAWGQRFLLTHGDALCLGDTEYQQFRRNVRAGEWQRQFLARPLAERAALARQMREKSEAHKSSAPVWADVDPAAAVAWMHSAGAHEMVHGHTHRPASEVLAPGYTRHVLSDWDLDQAQRAEVLQVTRDGLKRCLPAGPINS
jgi:UDP-2,3-diacylglucosamine hydrolase